MRAGLLTEAAPKPRRAFKTKPLRMGVMPGLNYDSIEKPLEIGEGERRPFALGEGFEIVRELVAQPNVTIAVENWISGPLMTDVVLAALAVEHGPRLPRPTVAWRDSNGYSG